MAVKSVSELNEVTTLNDDDLFMVSTKDGSGNYSSSNKLTYGSLKDMVGYSRGSGWSSGMFEANNLYDLCKNYELSSNCDLSKPHVYQTEIASHDSYNGGIISVILSCYLPEDTFAHKCGVSVICTSDISDLWNAYANKSDFIRGGCLEAILSTIDDICVTPVRELSCDSLLIQRVEETGRVGYNVFRGYSVETDHGVIRFSDYNVYDSFPTTYTWIDQSLGDTQTVTGVTNRYFVRAHTKLILGDTFSFKEWLNGDTFWYGAQEQDTDSGNKIFSRNDEIDGMDSFLTHLWIAPIEYAQSSGCQEQANVSEYNYEFGIPYSFITRYYKQLYTDMKLVVNDDISSEHFFIAGYDRFSNRLRRGSEIEIPKGGRFNLEIEGMNTNDPNNFECATLYPKNVKQDGVFWYDTYALSDLVDVDWDGIVSNPMTGAYDKTYSVNLPTWLTDKFKDMYMKVDINQEHNDGIWYPQMTSFIPLNQYGSFNYVLFCQLNHAPTSYAPSLSRYFQVGECNWSQFNAYTSDGYTNKSINDIGSVAYYGDARNVKIRLGYLKVSDE